MKTELSTASILPAPILRIVYPETFNEEQIRTPQAIVQKMKPVHKGAFDTRDGISDIADGDNSWFANYE